MLFISKIIQIVILLLIPFSLFCQEKSKPRDFFYIEANLQPGILLKTYPQFPESKNAWIFDLGFIRQTDGTKKWHQLYKYPKTGFSITYADLGNQEVLGQCVGLYPHFIIENSINNQLIAGIKVGLGIAIFNKQYESFTNTENILISSPLSGLATIRGEVAWSVSKQLSLTGGVGLWHFFNGHYKVPGIGATILALSAGAAFKFTSADGKIKYERLEKPEKKIKFGFSVGFGIHEFEGVVEPADGPQYPVYLGSVYLTKRLSYISKLSTGFDVNYYSDYHDYIINQQVFDDNEKQKSMTVVYYVAHEFLTTHLSLLLQVGINIYNPFAREVEKLGLINYSSFDLLNSNKIGFRYYFSNLDEVKLTGSMYLGVNIKTISFKADFAEMNIGFLF